MKTKIVKEFTNELMPTGIMTPDMVDQEIYNKINNKAQYLQNLFNELWQLIDKSSIDDKIKNDFLIKINAIRDCFFAK